MKINTEKNKTKNTITIDYENKRLSTFYFLPLLLIAGFVPLIVHAKYVDLSGTTQALYWTGQQQYLDFFSYWKAQWVVVLTAIALVIYILLYLQKKLPLKDLKQYYIPMGIYALFVIISTVFAIDTQTALWGFVDMYQGMFVLLSYILITFLTINFVNNERDVNLFVNAFLFLMIVEGIIGVGQYFGFDFFQTKLGKYLIVPNYLQVDNLSFSFGPKTIYGTLFNTNFVGSFATLMLPLSVGIFLSAKKRNRKIVSGIAVLLMIFTWIGCNSRAGYIGVVVGAIFYICLSIKSIKNNWKVLVSFIGVVFIALFGLNALSEGKILDRLKTFNLYDQISSHRSNYEGNLKINEINIKQNIVSIITRDEILKFEIENDRIYFYDGDDNLLKIEIKGNEISIKDNRYIGYKVFTTKEYPGITINRAKRDMKFYINNDGEINLIGTSGRLTDPTIVADKAKILDGLDTLASNRGYIWGRSIPLLKRYVFMGSGPDNYPFAFPQDDYIAKINAFRDSSIVVDKPHNFYLQGFINTGVVSFGVLVLLWGYYIVKSYKIYVNVKYDAYEKHIGLSCLISIIGYLSAGIFNDQVISVSPIFWILLGLGVSINIRLESKIA